jgi:ferrochelatase
VPSACPDPTSHAASAAPYDALLLLSFGGPEQPADVMPFLQNVTRDRNIPSERLDEVAEHYFTFGGRSPINDLCRELVTALRDDLSRAGIDLPVYWGNRNWHPYLEDTLRRMTADGVGRAACLVTSAYSSYPGCRQYRENLYDAVQAAPGPPRVDRLRHYWNHPGFVEPFVDASLRALSQLPAGGRLAFVTHSIPLGMAASSGPEGHAYEHQHRSAAAQVARRVGRRLNRRVDWELVYCSRSGPPQVPWLEPDVNDHLEALAADAAPGVGLVPIGFISDHMEVVYDLDTEAAATARRLGLPLVRAATPGTDPRFVAMARELLLERAATERGEAVRRRTVAGTAPSWDRCPAGCCPNPRAGRPALCGVDEQ